MTDNEKKVDLHDVEPLRPPLDEEPDTKREPADQAVGVRVEAPEAPSIPEDDDLERLRRA